MYECPMLNDVIMNTCVSVRWERYAYVQMLFLAVCIWHGNTGDRLKTKRKKPIHTGECSYGESETETQENE